MSEQEIKCKCVKVINEKLAQHNARIYTGFTISKDLSKIGSGMFVMLEKIDRKIRKPLPNVIMAYCPFCGAKL
jgi:hypothetical protein